MLSPLRPSKDLCTRIVVPTASATPWIGYVDQIVRGGDRHVRHARQLMHYGPQIYTSKQAVRRTRLNPSKASPEVRSQAPHLYRRIARCIRLLQALPLYAFIGALLNRLPPAETLHRATMRLAPITPWHCMCLLAVAIGQARAALEFCPTGAELFAAVSPARRSCHDQTL